MFRIQSQTLLLLLLLVSVSCQFQQGDDNIKNAIYDSQLHILGVDYPVNKDTSLQQLIHFSNIRKEGYGILLNIDSSYTVQEINTLKLKLQKQDINAIHSYDIGLQDSLKKSIRVAMEAAEFIWLIEKDDLNLKHTPTGYFLKGLKSDSISQNLIITHNQQYFKLKEFLTNQ